VFPHGKGFALRAAGLGPSVLKRGAHLQAFSQERPVGKNKYQQEPDRRVPQGVPIVIDGWAL